MTFLRNFDVSMKKKHLNKIFEKLDIDKDNKIKFSEFIVYHHRVTVENARDLFDSWNSDFIDICQIDSYIYKTKSSNPVFILLSKAISAGISRTCTAPLDRLRVTI